MATQPSGPPRIPLVGSFDSRLTTPSDGRIVNGYTEKTSDGEMVIKRPGITLFQGLPAGAPGGVFFWNADIYAVAGGLLYKNGVFLANLGPDGGPWSFVSTLGGSMKLVLHNLIHTHWWDGVNVGINVAAGRTFQRGFAYLDGTIYAGEQPASIFGSGINDPSTWNALNVIQAQQEPDFIVAVYKHHQYVVAFKHWTVEAFWDAGNPVGSPLQPAPGTLLQFGCRDPGSIQSFEDLMIWASATKSGSVGVMMMENLQPQTISTPAVERMLQDANWSITYSWSGRISGHRFYCLTLAAQNLSLVYDLTTQRWFQWTYGPTHSYLPFASSTFTAARKVLLQHENGSLYTLDQGAFQDDGLDIPVDIYTPTWDGGTRRRKYLQRLEVVGDQAGMRQAFLRWSDDDYQTFSSQRQIDLGKKRPMTEDLGTFRKRAFHLSYNAPTAFRVKALECTNMMLGSE